MTGDSLIEWSKREAARRRGFEKGWTSVHLRLAIGVLLAAEFCRRLVLASDAEMYGAALSSSSLWLAFALVLAASEVFAGPFRLYWRRDSHLLASLPISGDSMWKLAVYRSRNSALTTALALALPLIPLALVADGEFAARHLVPLFFAFLAGSFIGPASALFAGSIVASAKAQALIASVGGEFQAPKTSWLGILPGVSAAAIALAVLASNAWLHGGTPPGGSIAVVIGCAVGGSALFFVAAMANAKQLLPEAVREIAALDQEILAHVERSTPSPLERLAISLCGERSGLLARKDATLLRRRYPAPYFVLPLAILCLWIIALVQPYNYVPWGGAVLGGSLAYGVLMSMRSLQAPVEIHRLLDSLPLSAQDKFIGKFALAALRLISLCVLGGVPLALRAVQPLAVSVLVAGSLACALLSAGLLLRRGASVKNM